MTSLLYYPIQCSKAIGDESARVSFINRGKRFMDLSRRPGVVYKRYEGLTLSIPGLAEPGKKEIKEEVR